MFISPAFAQGTPAAGSGGADMLLSLMPFVLIFIIMYFLILRPQQKRAKQHQEMVRNLRRGDIVVTSGGLIARISKVIDDNEIELQLGEGLKVRQIRGMISEVRSKSEPVKDDAAG
jgi:preprotein translocase subunit YajC